MARKKKAERRYTRRKKKGTRRRRAKGIWSKAGALLVGGVPPLISGVEAAAYATAEARKSLPMMDKILLFGTRMVNNLTAGLTGYNVFDKITLSSQAAPYTVDNAWRTTEGDQAFPWLVTTATGLGVMLVDRIAGLLTGSGTKVAGVTLTGGK